MALITSCSRPQFFADGVQPPAVARLQTAEVASPERHAMSYVVLSQTGPATGQSEASFSAHVAGRVSVAFLAQGRGRYSLVARCDAPARFRPAETLAPVPAWQPVGQPARAVIAPGERARTLLDLDPRTERCVLRVTPGGRPSYEIVLRNEALAHPQIAALDQLPATCAHAHGGETRLERAFLNAGAGLALTCPQATGRTRLLADGRDALNARVEALTGARLSVAQLAARDPNVSLDYANAPQLDLIYVNYLNINADFAGYLMARMLAFHAARGTIVRILVSDIMMTGTDRNLLEGLAAQYPNVQIQPYRFPGTAAHGFEDHLARFHRISHVKLFATVSAQPGRSRAIIGGRNIHEGYFFEAPGDLSAYPFLHQYVPGQTRVAGGFSTYADFELELFGDQAVRSVVGHMAAIWHRDHDTQAPLQQVARSRQTRMVSGSMMRHFQSVPFADDTAQIDYFVDLIDAAEHSIHIAMPYLNLPEPIAQAFERAHARGVQVDLVTTLTIREWSGAIVSAFNRQFVERFGGWMRIRDYDPGEQMLHAKIIVIDDRLSLVMSTNLNARSFHHDLENGLVIWDPRVAGQLRAVIDGYANTATPVSADQDISGFLRWLTGVPMVRRAF